MNSSELFVSDVFRWTALEWQAICPYLWLCGGIALSTVFAAYRASSFWMRFVSFLSLAPFAGHLLWSLRSVPVSVMGTSLEVDVTTRLVGAVVAILAILCTGILGNGEEIHPEAFPLLQIAVLGMALLPGARDAVAFFVYLETFSIAGYILAGMNVRQEKALEAGLKYLLLGAYMSAFLLMGFVLLYTQVGSFDFSAIAQAVEQTHSWALVAGALLVVGSLAFKAALVPFHMWAPDVYQGAPLGSAAFLASATKVAVLGSLTVVLSRCGLLSFPAVKNFLQVIAVLSVFLGNLMAWSQQSLRRMLAYSSVANAGYAALVLSLGSEASGALFISLMLYGATVVAVFACLSSWRSASAVGNVDFSLSELGRLSGRVPQLLLGLWACLLFSLAGIPPFPGFLGKYVILKEVWQGHFYWGVGALILGTLLGLGYYLRALVPVFLEDSESKPSGTFSWQSGAAVSLVAAGVLVGCVLGFSRLQQWVELVEGFAR